MTEMTKNNTTFMKDSDRVAVAKLKELLKDDCIPNNFNDFDFLRWLQGHDYNYDHIAPNLRQHFRFYRCYQNLGMDVKYPNKPVELYWPRGFLGLTGKDDNFLNIDCLGRFDGEGLIKASSMHDILLSHFAIIENGILRKVRDHENEIGRQSGMIWIFDADKVQLNATNAALLAGPFRLYLYFLLTHFAEIFQVGLVVNTPSFIQFLWRLVRPILPEKTKRKIIFLGSDWKTEILKYIDADALPVHWGGNLVDENGDPMYSKHVVVPRKLPAQLIWSKKENEPTKDELDVLVIPAGRNHFYTVKVDEVDSKLFWYYFAEGNFGFGIFYTKNEDETDVEKMDMVYPQIKQMYTNWHPETDEIVCRRTGFYKLWFNNDFSWFTKLRIRYKILLKTKANDL